MPPKLARGVFTTWSPPTVNVHVPTTPPKCLSSLSLPIGKLCTDCSCWKVVCRAKVTYRPHAVHVYIKLQSKQTYGICATGIYENSTCSGSPQLFIAKCDMHVVHLCVWCACMHKHEKLGEVGSLPFWDRSRAVVAMLPTPAPSFPIQR